MSKLSKKQKLWLGFGIPGGTILTVGIIVSLVLLSSKNVLNNSCKYLGHAKEASSVNYSQIASESFQSYVDEVNSFSAKFTADYINEYDDKQNNIAISPISLYSALSLAAESTRGKTQEEILNALGSSLKNIEQNYDTLFSMLNKEFNNHGFNKSHKVGESNLSNSLWIEKNIDVNQSTIDVLSQNYHADIFEANFSSKAKRVSEYVSNYVKDKTHNLIDKKYEFDNSTLFVLMNTLYLKDMWNIFGNNLSKSDVNDKFVCRDTKNKRVDFYQTEYFNGKAEEGKGFKFFEASTYHGVGITFIVPDDGVKIESIFNKDNINNVLALKGEYLITDDNKMEQYHTRVHFPEFKASSDSELSNFLKSYFGIASMFGEEADFSNLITDKFVYVSRVDHTVELAVDKKGIEGAAATAIVGAGAAGPGEYKQVYEDFVVDKSFGYIVSLDYSIPLFSGIVNKV